MSQKRLIVLEGSIGVGKTTVGRAVARELDSVFVDWDACLVEAVGKALGEPFRKEDQWLQSKKDPSGLLHTKVHDGLRDQGTVIAAVSDSRMSHFLTCFEEGGSMASTKPPGFPFARLYGFGLNAPNKVLKERARLRQQHWDEGHPEPENFSLMPADESGSSHFGVGKIRQALDATRSVQEIVDHILKTVTAPNAPDPRWALRDTLGVPEIIYRPWLRPWG